MDSLATFEGHILEKLRNCLYKASDGTHGFRILQTELKANITNTVEALLILEGLNKSYLTEENRPDFVKFDKIGDFLVKEYNRIDTWSPANIKTIQISYCGLGLLLLGKPDMAIKIGDLLQQYECDEGGWGNHLKCQTPNILATFHVSQFLNRLKIHSKIPKWIEEININEQGCSFYPNSMQDETKNIAALSLLAYMRKFYFHKELDSKFVSYIGRYYEKIKFRPVFNINGEDLIQEKFSGYHVFAFGLANNIISSERNFSLVRDTLKKIPDNFCDMAEKNIPYILEQVRFVNSVRRAYDPFEEFVVTKDTDWSGFSDYIVLKILVAFAIGGIIYLILTVLFHSLITQNSIIGIIAIIMSTILPMIVTYTGWLTKIFKYVKKKIDNRYSPNEKYIE